MVSSSFISPNCGNHCFLGCRHHDFRFTLRFAPTWISNAVNHVTGPSSLISIRFTIKRRSRNLSSRRGKEKYDECIIGNVAGIFNRGLGVTLFSKRILWSLEFHRSPVPVRETIMKLHDIIPRASDAIYRWIYWTSHSNLAPWIASLFFVFGRNQANSPRYFDPRENSKREKEYVRERGREKRRKFVVSSIILFSFILSLLVFVVFCFCFPYIHITAIVSTTGLRD